MNDATQRNPMDKGFAQVNLVVIVRCNNINGLCDQELTGYILSELQYRTLAEGVGPGRIDGGDDDKVTTPFLIEKNKKSSVQCKLLA